MTEYILKNIRKREQELKYDFMPSMIEIIERPANRAGKIIIWGILSLFMIIFVWAALAKLDIVINASATILPAGNINIIKTYNGGVVKSINVVEGQHVEAGEVLIEFDEQLMEASEAQLLLQKARLCAEKQVCEALLSNEYENIDIKNYNEDIRPYVAVILELYNGYVNKNDILSKQAAAQGVDKTMAELNINANQIDLRMQLNKKLTDSISQLDEIESKLMQYKLSKEYQTVVASASGYINSVNVSRTGENVAAGQELISIVPDDAALEVVAYVADTDISDISMDMEAELKLKAYSYNKYGTVKAKVRYISPAAFSDKNMGNMYLVRLEIADIPQDINIRTGMQGELELKTGYRSVLDYILDPIRKGMGESLKEK